MRILHMTHCREWFADHFDHICYELGHTGETKQIADFGLTAEKANELWKSNIDYFNSFDMVFVSHLATLSRIFLQNNWRKPLRIWHCFRFDHFDPNNRLDRLAYQKLIQESIKRPNVKHAAAAEHDRLHTQKTLKNFPLDIVAPFVYINNDGKVQIPCKDKLFVVSKHNETLFMDLKLKLDELKIPAYKHRWQDGPPDIRGVSGIVHLPYTYLTRNLMENLALENVFFIPTLGFFQELLSKPGYFWDVHMREPNQDCLSEWYKPEHEKLFIQFSSFENLKSIIESPYIGDLLADRKKNIRAFNWQHNSKVREQWREFLS